MQSIVVSAAHLGRRFDDKECMILEKYDEWFKHRRIFFENLINFHRIACCKALSSHSLQARALLCAWIAGFTCPLS